MTLWERIAKKNIEWQEKAKRGEPFGIDLFGENINKHIKQNLFNYLKVIFIVVFAASLVVNWDYLSTHYGGYKNFFVCRIGKFGVNDKVKSSVVRIVGGYAEGSGFFIQPNKILTNFHVIADEPSPKIIFPDGNFIVPEKIIGNKDMDLAIISTKQEYPDMVMDVASGKSMDIYDNEALFATGYAMGTDLIGSATQLKGNFIDAKEMGHSASNYIQTTINLVEGMSGGPLTNQCGKVLGINTLGIGGISLFIPVFKEFSDMDEFTDKDIKKIKVDPSVSPEEAVKAFYTYLKARKMEEAFNLLSKEYILNANFEEWDNRFKDVIDVDVITSEKYENTADTVFIKFTTQNWTGNEIEINYYEGTWRTVSEDGIYKLLKSNIKEISDPDFSWFY